MMRVFFFLGLCSITVPAFAQTKVFTGEASYYADKLAGKSTASGEVYDPKKYTAASRDFPFHTIVKVTNLSNNKSVYVRINDKLAKKTRIIDLSKIAAEKIDMLKTGTAQVKVEYVGTGEAGKDPSQNISSKTPLKKETPAKLDLEEEDEEDEDDESEEDLHFTPPSTGTIPEKSPEKFPEKLVTQKIISKEEPSSSRYTNFEGKPQFPKGIGLQIASFKNESFAIKAATRLHLAGYSNIVIERYTANSPPLYRLIAWGFKTEEEALQFGKKLEKLGYNVYFIYRFQE